MSKVTPQLIADGAAPLHPVISPDGRRVAYTVASKIRTPVLILHGEDDTNVPVGQATYFHRALRWFGVEHEFVVYPREGHAIQERSHQLDVLRRTRGWFDRWLVDPASDRTHGAAAR
ncbi:alpha/beta hydrolase family protein [Nonomuraea sp. NPDC004354]